MNQRATLVKAINKAATFAEQVSAVAALDDFDRRRSAVQAMEREISWADTAVTATLSPVAVHEFNTSATEWLVGTPTSAGDFHHEALAKAATWYRGVSPEVKADDEEFAIQARGMVHRMASAYGEDANAAQEAALMYLSHLRHREGASGLDQIQQTTAPDGVTQRETPLPPDVFDTFQTPIAEENEAVTGTETSDRNPTWNLYGGPTVDAPYDGPVNNAFASHRTSMASALCNQCGTHIENHSDVNRGKDLWLDHSRSSGGDHTHAPTNSSAPFEAARKQGEWEDLSESAIIGGEVAGPVDPEECSDRNGQFDMYGNPTEHASYNGPVNNTTASVAMGYLYNLDNFREAAKDVTEGTDFPTDEQFKGLEGLGYTSPFGTGTEGIEHVSEPGYGRERLVQTPGGVGTQQPIASRHTAADGDSQSSADRYPAQSYLGDSGSSSAAERLASEYGMSPSDVTQAFPDPQKALELLDRQKSAHLMVTAAKCSNCNNGNHSGTNGTSGCKGGNCTCTYKNCGKNSGGGDGSGNPDTRGDKQAWDKEGRRTQGASTLDQIQQTTAPDGVTFAPTPLPAEVMFPLIVEDEQNTGDLVDGDTRAAVEKQGHVVRIAHTTLLAPPTDSLGGETHHAECATCGWEGSHTTNPMEARAEGKAHEDSASKEENPRNFNLRGLEDSKSVAAGKTAATIFHEMYGEVSRPQLAAYRKHNVSPADHDMLAEEFGEHDHNAITKAVKDRSPNGYFQPSFPGSSLGSSWGKRTSGAFTPADAQSSPEFRKGYTFASKWKPGTRLVSTGSAEFEAGLYSGITDNPSAQGAWVMAHAKQGAKYPVLAARMASHDAFSQKIAQARGLRVEAGYVKTALTETDLDTAAPGTSPSPVGDTPINGPGRPGPLAGQTGANAPGGAAPYNGADPMGKPVVPGAVLPPSYDEQSMITQTGPPNPLAGAQTVAFRKRVQAGLLAMSKN